jgi:YggT family protein
MCAATALVKPRSGHYSKGRPVAKGLRRMKPIIEVLLILLDFYWFVVMASVILSWLINFNVINTRNDVVRAIWRMVYDLTEPVFRTIRRVVPPLGGIDFSPFFLLLLIYLLQRYLQGYVLPFVP